MNFNPPKKVVWWISLIVGAVGVLAQFVTIPVLGPFSFWLVAVGWVLMLLATTVRGM